MTMIAITIIISMSVNPLLVRPLPFRVRSSICRLVHALGIHIENILAAPTGARRIVLHAPEAPIPRVGHRVERDPAQKLELGIGRLPRPFDAVDESLQRLG